MSRVYAISDEYMTRYAALDPLAATSMGVPGHDAEMTDFSPAGAGATATLARATLSQLADAPIPTNRDRIARGVLVERLELHLEIHEAGEPLRDLNVIASPLQNIRSAFDLMARETADDWRNIAERMKRVSQGLTSFRASLDDGLARRLPVARRQVLACAKQAGVWSGDSRDTPSFFSTLLDEFDRSAIDNAALRADVERGAQQASQAYREFGRYLEIDYLPSATERDPVGPERYGLRSRVFSGLTLDLEETYAWGWEEVARLRAEMAETAERIQPGADVAEAIALLEEDDEHAINGVEPFRQWMQELQDRTIAELDGVHFDIPDPVKHIEALIAPPGGALAMYYTGPSEDFSRPGRTWYPTAGQTRFPLWREVSVAYHEGVPGHHLQVAQARYLADELSRYQRLLAWSSGYGEGWALYAERLMAELGYLDAPDVYMGMLSNQAMRAARVVVDIGLHLELEIPASEPNHGGERWRPEFALPFLVDISHFPEDWLSSEVDRYLGWPGQAISYKVGEREWLRVRDDSRRRLGDEFDLKLFHSRALNMGPMGLAQMRRELAAL